MDARLPDNSTFYALEQLSAIKTAISALAEIMPVGRNNVDRHLEGNPERAKDYYLMLQKEQRQTIDAINQSRLFLREIGEDALANYGGNLSAQLSAFNLMTRDYAPLAAALRDYAGRLPESTTASAAVIGRCMNAVRMGYYPTDLANVAHIKDAITFPADATVNLLDPCCGEGLALKRLIMDSVCLTYGIELDEGRAHTAQQVLHRVGFGSFFHSRISHEVFHMVFLNPPYLTTLTEGGNRTRNEKRFLIETLPHLMMGGLMVYIVPHYRLTPDICRVLCDNLEDISVYRFTDAEFRKHSQVAVMGMRKKKSDGSQEANVLAQLAYSADDIPCITSAPEGQYTLPPKAKAVETFKGAVFNQVELARQLAQSKSFDSVLQNKSMDKSIRRPPLPFTFSQLGLIGGSGYINGLIECDCPHVIKGRIVKAVKSDISAQNFNDKGQHVSSEITEKVSNKMIFNILTSEGFMQLA